jgi:hypothetical protein
VSPQKQTNVVPKHKPFPKIHYLVPSVIHHIITPRYIPAARLKHRAPHMPVRRLFTSTPDSLLKHNNMYVFVFTVFTFKSTTLKQLTYREAHMCPLIFQCPHIFYLLCSANHKPVVSQTEDRTPPWRLQSYSMGPVDLPNFAANVASIDVLFLTSPSVVLLLFYYVVIFVS